MAHIPYRYLRRPFRSDQLLAVITAALAHRQLAPDGEMQLRHNADDEGWVELTAPSRQEYLDRFQEFCENLVNSRFDEEARNELKIAVQELGQNAIEWGNRLNKDTKIRMAYRLLEDRILIRIADEGAGFDPSTLPDPTVDPIALIQARERSGKRPGGFGVHLARKIMDAITYNEQGNVVIMEKRFVK